jgi:hypothetical protein
MNNCEKKLDALIDALGFDVEVNTTYTSIYKKKDVNCSGDPVNGAMPERMYEKTNYKLTKRKENNLPVDYNQQKRSFIVRTIAGYEDRDISQREFVSILADML